MTKKTAKQIDEVVTNAVDRLILAPIDDAVKAGATIRRKKRAA